MLTIDFNIINPVDTVPTDVEALLPGRKQPTSKIHHRCAPTHTHNPISSDTNKLGSRPARLQTMTLMNGNAAVTTNADWVRQCI